MDLMKAFGLALLAALLAAPAAAQTYKAEYTVSTVVGAPFPWGLAAGRWAALVKERTQGRVNLTIHPGAALVGGDQTREFAALREGAIDMAVGSTINWSPQVPELNLFSLPFLMPDHKALDAITGGAVGWTLFESIAAQAVTPLAWGENGFRELTNSKRAVRAPADLQGLRIRVVGLPLFDETFAALGALPVDMNWTEARPALAAGTVDGQENPLAIFEFARLAEAGQKHVTLWGYVADPLIFAVNPRIWSGFSIADQAILRQAAVEAGLYGKELARKGVTAADPAILKDIEARGVTVTRLTTAERQAFRDATRPVYERWKARIGAELVGAAERAVDGR